MLRPAAAAGLILALWAAGLAPAAVAQDNFPAVPDSVYRDLWCGSALGTTSALLVSRPGSDTTHVPLMSGLGMRLMTRGLEGLVAAGFTNDQAFAYHDAMRRQMRGMIMDNENAPLDTWINAPFTAEECLDIDADTPDPSDAATPAQPEAPSAPAEAPAAGTPGPGPGPRSAPEPAGGAPGPGPGPRSLRSSG